MAELNFMADTNITQKDVHQMSSSTFQPRGLPQTQKKERIQSSNVSTLCKMLKFAIGAGVLALPKGFSRVQIFGGVITVIYALVIQFYSWIVLTKALEEKTKLQKVNKRTSSSRRRTKMNGPPRTQQTLPNDSIKKNSIISEQVSESSSESDDENDNTPQSQKTIEDENSGKPQGLITIELQDLTSIGQQNLLTHNNEDVFQKQLDVTMGGESSIRSDDDPYQEQKDQNVIQFVVVDPLEFQITRTEKFEQIEHIKGMSPQNLDAAVCYSSSLSGSSSDNEDKKSQSQELQYPQASLPLQEIELKTEKISEQTHQFQEDKTQEINASMVSMVDNSFNKSKTIINQKNQADQTLPKKKRIIEDYRNYKDEKTVKKEAEEYLQKLFKERKRQQDKIKREARKVEYLDCTVYDLIRKEFKNNHWALATLQICTLLLLWGCNVSYCQFLYSILNQVDSYFYTNALFKLAVGFIIFFIICCFSFAKQMESVRSYIYMGSYLSLIILYFVICLCLYQIKLNQQTEGNDDTPFETKYPNPIVFYDGVEFLAIPQFFGTALYSFDINGVITEIRTEMKSQYQFPTILLISMVIEASIYIFVGAIGYMAYGQYTDDIITSNVSTTIKGIGTGFHFIFLVLQLLYAFSLMITVILHNVVAFRIMTEMLNKDQNMVELQESGFFSKMIIRIPFILSFVMVASYFQAGFSVVVSLQGCVTSVIIGFILPYILYHKLLGKNKRYLYILVINTFVLSMGISSGMFGLVYIFLHQ